RPFPLLDEAAGQVPVAEPRLDAAPREQHAAVALDQALDGGQRVRPIALAAHRAAKGAFVGRQVAAATRAEAPAVLDPHDRSCYGDDAARRAAALRDRRLAPMVAPGRGAVGSLRGRDAGPPRVRDRAAADRAVLVRRPRRRAAPRL